MTTKYINTKENYFKVNEFTKKEIDVFNSIETDKTIDDFKPCGGHNNLKSGFCGGECLTYYVVKDMIYDGYDPLGRYCRDGIDGWAKYHKIAFNSLHKILHK